MSSDRLAAGESSSKRFSSATEVSELLEECLAHVQQPTKVELPAVLKKSRTAAKGFGKSAIVLLLLPVAVLIAFPLLQNGSRTPDQPTTLRTDIPSEPLDSEYVGETPDNENVVVAENTTEAPTTASTSDPVDTTPVFTEADLQWDADDDLTSLRSTLRELKHELNDDFETSE